MFSPDALSLPASRPSTTPNKLRRTIRQTQRSKNVPEKQNSNDLVHSLFENFQTTDGTSRKLLNSVLQTSQNVLETAEFNDKLPSAIEYFYKLKQDLKYMELYSSTLKGISSDRVSSGSANSSNQGVAGNIAFDGSKNHARQLLDILIKRDEFFLNLCSKLLQLCPAISENKFKISPLCSKNWWCLIAILDSFYHLLEVT